MCQNQLLIQCSRYVNGGKDAAETVLWHDLHHAGYDEKLKLLFARTAVLSLSAIKLLERSHSIRNPICCVTKSDKMTLSFHAWGSIV